jgi:hypothetical protein
MYFISTMKFLLLPLLFIFTGLFAQDSALTFSRVVSIENVSKNELYDRAKSWFAETYKSAKDVIQMDDKEAGKLIGKGNFRYDSKVFSGSTQTTGWISYTITLQVKDNKYRYEITNFRHDGNGDYDFGLITSSENCPYEMKSTFKNWRDKVWKDIKSTIAPNADDIVLSLTSYMNKQAKKDDW